MNTDKRRFELWRQDDNGQRFLIERFAERRQAEQRQAELSRIQHKQFYWISERATAGGQSLRDRWNSRWQAPSEGAWEPDPWLVKVAPRLPAGDALDVACGRGRNSLFLAERGLAVTALDVSDEALAQLGREAARRGLMITTGQVDLEDAPRLPDVDFDLVIVFCYLHRPLVPQLMERVRPGGVMVMRTFSSAGAFAAGELNPAFVLHPGELLELFAGWQVLTHEEGLEASRKGGSLAGIVARRPTSGVPAGNPGGVT